MADKHVLTLGLSKCLNTIGDPRHTFCLPGEHCFEVQKMTVKVTDEGDTQRRNLPFKGALRKEWISSGKGEEMYTRERERKGRRHSGRGGSRFEAYALSKVKIANLGIRP